MKLITKKEDLANFVVSDGCTDVETLARRFTKFGLFINPNKTKEILQRGASMDEFTKLFQEFAPEGYHFGVKPDTATFGFWRI